MKKNNFLLIVLAFFSYSIQAGVYKHVDERGNVTYSNVPSSNAKKIDLPPIVVVPSVDSGDVEERIAKRREAMKLEEQREKIQSRITEEEKRLSELKAITKTALRIAWAASVITSAISTGSNGCVKKSTHGKRIWRP